MTLLTERYTRAVDYARVAHATQYRKGSGIPYIYHLLAVSSLVIEFGGNEDQAIAGLLHDVIEDCGAEHGPRIREQFGQNVARIVEACTDGTAEAKADHTDPEARRQDWLRRKQAYLQHLAEADDEVLLVSGCDKLHNARALVQDLEDPAVGEAVFGRFTGGREGTVWYYGALRDLFRARNAATAVHLQRLVAALEAGAGSAPGQGASHGAGR
jgi:(p)ppGpp synthase/HD superfamily hydrolase